MRKKLPKSILKRWLRVRHITYAQFAFRVGVSAPHLTNICNRHQKNIHISLVRRIAILTDIPVKDLIDDMLLDYHDAA